MVWLMVPTTFSILKQTIRCMMNIRALGIYIGASIIGFWYWCTDQHIVQRVLGQTKGEPNDVVMKRARREVLLQWIF